MCTSNPSNTIPETRSGWRPLLLLVALAIALLVPRMVTGRLRHWDEAWYAQVSRETLHQSGSPFTLRWNGDVWFHKPFLGVWGTGLSFYLFGESVFTARLFSALCGLGVIAIVYRFGAQTSSMATGLVAGLLLVGCPEFARYATRGQLDLPLTLCMTLQLVAFWHGLDQPRWHLAGGVCFGLGILTKGSPAALALAVQWLYVVVSRDRRCLGQRDWWLAPLIGLLLALPWHLQQWHRHGDAFLSAYADHHLGQVAHDLTRADSTAPAGYYLDVLIAKDQPWGWAILASVAIGARQLCRRKDWQLCRREDRLIAFLWSWTVAIPLALSFVRAKWHWYLVPMYPGAALLAAVLFVRAVRHRRREVTWVTFTTALAIGLACWTGFDAMQEPANTQQEDLLPELVPVVDRFVPRASPIHTLQIADPDASIFPIATLYYCGRQVHAIRGLEQLTAIAGEARNVFFLMAHVSQLDGARAAGASQEKGAGFVIEPLGSVGPVVLVAVVPGWLDDELTTARQRAGR